METSSPQAVNWRQVGLFLGLTFALSWALDLLLYLTAGYGQNQATVTLLQLQMLIPAAVAIVLGMFVFPGSPIYYRTYRGPVRWFLYFFLLFTLIFVVLGVLAALGVSNLALSAAGGALGVVGLLFVIVLRGASGREAFARAGLAFGNPRDWLFFALVVVAFYLSQSLLNHLFNLGAPANLPLMAIGVGMDQTSFFLAALFQTVILGPFVGLLFGFGEEYGWRGYLQSALLPLGPRRAVLLIGVIWGIWHWPIIWMGHNYPGQPLLGTLLMTLYTIALAVFLGYTVLKTGSIWLAAYLHALNNQFYAFLLGLVYTPDDMTFSFGSGLYGIPIALALAALLLLLDPVWRKPPALPVLRPGPAAGDR